MRFLAYGDEKSTGVALFVNGAGRGETRNGTYYEGSLQEWIVAGDAALRFADARLAAAPVIDPATVRRLPPLARPGKILCVGLHYADHTEESGYLQPEHPTLFPRFASSLVAVGDPIVRPFVSDTLDYEGELVAVIGQGGRHIPKASNTDHLIFDVATLVSGISEAITLEPGDISVTGTPSGIGHARTPRLYMRPGDVVEVEIESIGILRNPVVD